jgi:hypothetical protein
MKFLSACRSLLFAIAMVPVAGFSQTLTTPDTIWSLINELLSQAREKEFFERLLGSEPEISSLKEFGETYSWAGKVFADGVEMQKPSLTIWRNGLASTFHMSLSGRCVPISEIETFYPDTKLMSLPTHGYPDAVLTYMVATSRGKVTFFTNAHTRCLVTVKISS